MLPKQQISMQEFFKTLEEAPVLTHITLEEVPVHITLEEALVLTHITLEEAPVHITLEEAPVDPYNPGRGSSTYNLGRGSSIDNA